MFPTDILVVLMLDIVCGCELFVICLAGWLSGEFQSDHRRATGFGPFDLPTCGLLRKGRDHSHIGAQNIAVVVASCSE